MTTMAEADAAAGGGAAEPCPVCGEQLIGQFCHRCGEERPHPERLSVRYFFRQTVAELTDFEHAKVFLTLRSLFLRPGFLTNEWIAGRKSPYVAPLKLLLISFALYFFLFTFYRPVAVYDLQALVDNDTTGQSQKAFADLAATVRLEPAELIARTNEWWQTYTSLLQLATVVLMAALLKLAYAQTARRFVEHFVFSLHLFSFDYLLPVVTWPLYLLTGVTVSRAAAALMAVSVVVGLVYLFLALRRVYGQTYRWTLLKTGLIYVVSHLILVSLAVVTLIIALIHVVARL